MRLQEYDPQNRILRQALAISLINALMDDDFVEVAKQARDSYRFQTKERVFSRSSEFPNVMIYVYSSIVGLEVRNSGKDAIRVCLLYSDSDNKIVPISKEKRVHRTGQIPDILGRVQSRIKSVEATVKSIPVCKDCGAPTREFTRRRDGHKFIACANFCVKKGITKRKIKEMYKPVEFAEFTKSLRPNSSWSRDDVDNIVRNDHKALESAILTLYSFQTADEQVAGHTNQNNGKGFSSYCASSGSFYAKWILGIGRTGKKEYPCKHLKREWQEKARNIVLRHSRQLVDEVNK